MVNRKKEIVACESSIYLGMVGWPVHFLTMGRTLLEIYHPMPRHCEVG